MAFEIRRDEEKKKKTVPKASTKKKPKGNRARKKAPSRVCKQAPRQIQNEAAASYAPKYKVGDTYTFKLTGESYKGLEQIAKELGWWVDGMRVASKKVKARVSREDISE